MLVLKKCTDYLPTYTSTRGEQVLKCYVENKLLLAQLENKGWYYNYTKKTVE